MTSRTRRCRRGSSCARSSRTSTAPSSSPSTRRFGTTGSTETSARRDSTALFERTELDTSLWVAAWDGDEIAGVVQSWIWADENERLGVRRGWLERISVRRPWRRRGLGRAITAEALRRLRAAGLADAMLGVDAGNPTGALGLYAGMGFEVAQRSMTMGGRRRSDGGGPWHHDGTRWRIRSCAPT